MTETECLACADPEVMLEALGHVGTPRKLRLFAVACCLRIWARIDDGARPLLLLAGDCCDGPGAVMSEMRLQRQLRPEQSRRAGSTARYALRAVRAAAYAPDVAASDEYSMYQGCGAARSAAQALLPDGVRNGDTSDFQLSTTWRHERAGQSGLVREIFGNPFRLVTFSPTWRTGTALTLTRQMYESRDFGAMPILADALQDAGCDNEDILNHCRGDGPHVRGCWVVDLVLGKE